MVVLCSCTEENQPTRTNENLSQLLISGSWKVILFEDNGIDRTDDFEGINLLFSTSGRVEAFRDTQSLDEGSWQAKVEEGRVEFELSFSTNPLFKDLSDEWYQILIINDRVTFREDDPQSEDQLILQKV